MRVLLTGGGTAGHINPAIAIANYIKEKEANSEFLFVGTEHGLEKTLVPKCGYNIKFINVMGLRRSLTLENVKVLYNYIKSFSDAKKIIKEFKPDIVIGTGGYVCASVVKMASKMKIPTLIHEQNVFPGLAVKMLSNDADITAISFSETREMMKAKKMVETGNPLRPNLFKEIDKKALMEEYGFEDKKLVLVFGGSLGAPCINKALAEMLKSSPDFNIIASTGEKNYENTMKYLKELGVDTEKMKNVKILPYLYNMEDVFGAADLIVGRAGAITVSEITALGKAAILIPSPYVAHNHQEYNARYLEKKGASRVILENELTGEVLLKNIKEITGNEETLSAMQESSKKIGICDSCEKIYNCVLSLIK
ncbi:MAG: undecaprenyldiphospho-muramoylpentapeptide beta-N-acetylglucosaminyltransferase [Clostridia bacterium]|nr:undecaprenyldiphospho-muramoylpentapeptide beta-N-acetylglucosaminyltransferase [Clostridia bacterium]